MRRLLSLLALPLLLGSASPQRAVIAPILAVHDAERAAVGVPRLVWDGRLAAGATRWARVLARSNQLMHEADVTGDRAGPGENLWMGTRGAWSPTQMVRAWAEEKRSFRRGVFPDVRRRGGDGMVGHYTQMVWRDTDRIGCGLASGPTMDVLVCRYETPGNVYGHAVF